MKKIIIVVLIAVLAMSAFAADQNWAKSYNKDGQLNLFASVGYLGYFDGSVGVEYTLGEFDFGGIPVDYGIMARGVVEAWGFGSYSGIFWGVAPMFAMHLGLNNLPFEFFLSAGIGFSGYSYGSGNLDPAYPGFGIAFASFEGAMWHFADKFALLLEYGYIGVSIWGVGIEMQL